MLEAESCVPGKDIEPIGLAPEIPLSQGPAGPLSGPGADPQGMPLQKSGTWKM